MIISKELVEKVLHHFDLMESIIDDNLGFHASNTLHDIRKQLVEILDQENKDATTTI